MRAWIISLIVIGGVLLLLFVLLGLSLIKYLLVSLIYKKKYLIQKKAITFLSERPKINGLLEDNLVDLPIRKFDARIRLSPFQSSIKPSYRLAYGYDFFYVFIEINANEIVKRDRGYQNGDGFHILLANPKANHQLTDEFYVYGFSPNEDSEGNMEKYIWYHDIKVNLSKLGNDVQFAVRKNNGKIGYELLLPWNEAYPLHPWVLEGKLGFNLAFIKAKKSLFDYFTVLFDWRFQAENQKRKYTLLTFESPVCQDEEVKSYVVMDRNSIEGTNAQIKIATVTSDIKEEILTIIISNKNGDSITSEEIHFNCIKGLNENSLEVHTSELSPGSYIVKWQTSSDNGEKELSILPIFNYDELTSRVEEIQDKISKSSFHTLQFMLNQINKEINQIKWYENYPNLIISMLEFLEIIQQAENGEDSLARKTGSFRRAFVSEIDKSLQPYSIIIPENYDPSRKYPLIVFLHGSGVDDRNSLKLIDYINGDYIKLAPKTRGTSHYFGKQETLVDIKEAIEDVKANYNINNNAILLAGFSMGGYGVYRMYMEYPKIFKALAVLSGEPNVRFFIRLFTKGKFKNFLKKKNILPFKQIPIFIFHGTLDKNCPYKKIDDFVKALHKYNKNVVFCSDKVGHKKIENNTIIAQFNSWLQENLK
ncbi:MAG TPA: prolyl oligopeptidase family serine peptidase [Candidatus Bathyarchaeia archaeon]|nr:prolyl oligopeptidase family serine peptidase [Candidatus Bathyarchaeia archaeon]